MTLLGDNSDFLIENYACQQVMYLGANANNCNSVTKLKLRIASANRDTTSPQESYIYIYLNQNSYREDQKKSPV